MLRKVSFYRSSSGPVRGRTRMNRDGKVSKMALCRASRGRHRGHVLVRGLDDNPEYEIFGTNANLDSPGSPSTSTVIWSQRPGVFTVSGGLSQDDDLIGFWNGATKAVLIFDSSKFSDYEYKSGDWLIAQVRPLATVQGLLGSIRNLGYFACNFSEELILGDENNIGVNAGISFRGYSNPFASNVWGGRQYTVNLPDGRQLTGTTLSKFWTDSSGNRVWIWGLIDSVPIDSLNQWLPSELLLKFHSESFGYWPHDPLTRVAGGPIRPAYMVAKILSYANGRLDVAHQPFGNLMLGVHTLWIHNDQFSRVPYQRQRTKVTFGPSNWPVNAEINIVPYETNLSLTGPRLERRGNIGIQRIVDSQRTLSPPRQIEDKSVVATVSQTSDLKGLHVSPDGMQLYIETTEVLDRSTELYLLQMRTLSGTGGSETIYIGDSLPPIIGGLYNIKGVSVDTIGRDEYRISIRLDRSVLSSSAEDLRVDARIRQEASIQNGNVYKNFSNQTVLYGDTGCFYVLIPHTSGLNISRQVVFWSGTRILPMSGTFNYIRREPFNEITVLDASPMPDVAEAASGFNLKVSPRAHVSNLFLASPLDRYYTRVRYDKTSLQLRGDFSKYVWREGDTWVTMASYGWSEWRGNEELVEGFYVGESVLISRKVSDQAIELAGPLHKLRINLTELIESPSSRLGLGGKITRILPLSTNITEDKRLQWNGVYPLTYYYQWRDGDVYVTGMTDQVGEFGDNGEKYLLCFNSPVRPGVPIRVANASLTLEGDYLLKRVAFTGMNYVAATRRLYVPGRTFMFQSVSMFKFVLTKGPEGFALGEYDITQNHRVYGQDPYFTLATSPFAEDVTDGSIEGYVELKGHPTFVDSGAGSFVSRGLRFTGLSYINGRLSGFGSYVPSKHDHLLIDGKVYDYEFIGGGVLSVDLGTEQLSGIDAILFPLARREVVSYTPLNAPTLVRRASPDNSFPRWAPEVRIVNFNGSGWEGANGDWKLYYQGSANITGGLSMPGIEYGARKLISRSGDRAEFIKIRLIVPIPDESISATRWRSSAFSLSQPAGLKVSPRHLAILQIRRNYVGKRSFNSAESGRYKQYYESIIEVNPYLEEKPQLFEQFELNEDLFTSVDVSPATQVGRAVLTRLNLRETQ